jgi:hypothetical protein
MGSPQLLNGLSATPLDSQLRECRMFRRPAKRAGIRKMQR